MAKARTNEIKGFAIVSSSSPSPLLLLLLLSIVSSFALSSCSETVLQGVNLEKPVLNFTLLPHAGHFCQRIHITGVSRLNLKSYANLIRVNMKPGILSERLNEKMQVCFHRNSSIGLCQCEEGEWESLQQGQWNAIMTPYHKKYLHIKLKEKTFNFFTISIKEEFQQWRLVCLGLGFLLLIMAPIVSNWLPFYYSSSMALGVLLVVLLILFQGMKLLPTGRKNILYLSIYGSVLGVGSFLAHYLSTLVNSILVGFGLSEELNNPVFVFVVVGVVLLGALLGYYIVRKYVLSEEGVVDAGVAQFVKWAMRFVATVCFFQSTLDPPLALIALAASWSICYLITSKRWWYSPMKNRILWQQNARQRYTSNRQAEFFSPPKMHIKRSASAWGNSSTPNTWYNPTSQNSQYKSPVKGARFQSLSSTLGSVAFTRADLYILDYFLKAFNSLTGSSTVYKRISPQQEDYYSTYHKTPTRKFSKKEWEDFTHESTSAALADWASSPKVTKWIAENAPRMRLDPPDSSDNLTESSSASSEETEVASGINGRSGLFRW